MGLPPAPPPAPSPLPDSAPPPLARTVSELAALLLRPSWFGRDAAGAAGHDGGGRSVLVLPGFLSPDALTARLRNTLAAANYRAAGWDLGVNLRFSRALVEAMLRRIDALPPPVSLVGWSLGGLYARELARHRAGIVDRVVTLGTPFSGDRHANRGWRLYELLNDHAVDRPPVAVDPAVIPPAITFALWSPIDGIVAPAAARGRLGEADCATEVRCRHLEFVSTAEALRAVLAVLAADLAPLRAARAGWGAMPGGGSPPQCPV